MISSGFPALDSVLGLGYPERSAILVEGDIGTGKEGICFRFLEAAGSEDQKVVLTHRGATEVIGDMQAYHVNTDGIVWIDRDGNNDQNISANIREIADASAYFKRTVSLNKGKIPRIYTDIISPFLLLNDAKRAYLFFHDFIMHVKNADGIMLATVEGEMHSQQELATLEQLFDGVLEFKIMEHKLSIMTLFRIKKMRGLVPRSNYFRLSLQPQRGVIVDSINI